MRELNFLDLHHLVCEVQVCVGSRLNKVFDHEGLLLQMHKSGVGKFLLRVSDGALYLVSSKGELPSEVSSFCQKLRKHLEGKKLVVIEQLGSERVVKFVFETQKERFFLFAEFFGKGNVVLTDGTMRILVAREEHVWKDREVTRGSVYVLPPSKFDLFSLCDELPFDEKALAQLGLGKLLAREVLARGGGLKAYKAVLSEPCAPRRYEDGLISPIRLAQYVSEGLSASSFSSLVEADMAMNVLKLSPSASALEKKRKKIVEVISVQQSTVDELEARAVQLHRKGEVMYELFSELSVLLQLGKRELMSVKNVGQITIKKVDLKTGTIIVEVPRE